MDDDSFVPPPPHAPPLLAPQDLHHLCTHGYLGLNLPEHLAAQYDHLLATADAFFAQPLDEKEPYRPGGGHGPPSSPTNTERGYTHLAGEKEFLTLRRSLTHLPPGLVEAAAPVWHDTARLLQRILADIGTVLGLGPQAWDAVVADSLEPGDGAVAPDEGSPRHPKNDPPTLLRLFRYEPGGGGAEPHRDLGLLTLCVTWGKGLQVRPRPHLPQPEQRPPQDGGEQQQQDEPAADADQQQQQPPQPPQQPQPPAWVDAPRVTVMTGDTLFVLSGHRVPSASHRVVVDPVEMEAAKGKGKGKSKGASSADNEGDNDPATPLGGRRSIVFALRATTAGAIDLSAFGGFGQVGAAELYGRIRRQRVNVNVGKTARDAMRTRFRAGGDKNGGKNGDDKDDKNGDDDGKGINTRADSSVVDEQPDAGVGFSGGGEDGAAEDLDGDREGREMVGVA